MPGDYSEELVEQLADGLTGSNYTEAGNLPAGSCDCADCRRGVARAILDALSSSGRLVPEGSEVREEWGTRHLDIERPERVTRSAAGEQSARRRFEDLDEVWGHHAELIRRRVITTPWTPTETEEKP